MAGGAERNKILFRIVSSLAAKLLMMDFQIRHRAAQLTASSIPFHFRDLYFVPAL
jgi:hypothetical protein